MKLKIITILIIVLMCMTGICYGVSFSQTAPSGVKATSTDYNRMYVKWNALKGAKSYEVYVKVGTSWAKLKTLSKTSCTLNSLECGKQYVFRVRGYNGKTYSGYGTASAKAVPNAPVISVKKKGENAITVSWNAVNGASSYKVYQSKDGSSFEATEAKGTSATFSSLFNGKYKYYVQSFRNGVSGKSSVRKSAQIAVKIPEGATYKIGSSGEKLSGGQPFPSELKTGDSYSYGDYTYRYGYASNSADSYKLTRLNTSQNGWGVKVKKRNKTSYGNPLSSIYYAKVTNLSETWANCTKMTKPPVLSSNVVYLQGSFSGCTKLTSAPKIPSTVTDMYYTFGLSGITKAPVIPKSVKRLEVTFYFCKSLTGNVKINCTPENYRDCFQGTVKSIKITGGCGNKAKIAATSTNKNVKY